MTTGAFNSVCLIVACACLALPIHQHIIDTPMLNVPEGKTIEAIFTRPTDMRGIDACFRGPRPTFEEDMTREAPASE